LPNIQKIEDYLKKNPEYKKKVIIVLRLLNQKMHSRGGNAPNYVGGGEKV